MGGDFGLSTTTVSGAFVLAAAGEIDLFTAPDLREAISVAVQADQRRIVIDLTSTTFLDSSGLGVLVTARQQLLDLGGALTVVNVDPAIARTLAITGLDGLLTVRPTLPEALVALGS